MAYLQEDMDILASYIKDMGISNKKILITGGTGLIGSLTTKAFLTANQKYDMNNEVFVLVRDLDKAKLTYQYYENAGLKYVIGDVCEELPVCEYDYIIHTASPTASGFFMSHPVEVLDINYTGTKNILTLARNCNAKSVVSLSSMEAFGAVEEIENKLSEKDLGYIDISNVRSCYSEGKRVIELMCKCFSAEYGVPVKVARLAQTFGAGISPTENRVFAQFARSALKGENIVLHTTGESVGNYCYTRDVIKAIITILLKGENGESYTVVNEASSMEIREMAAIVAENFSEGKSKVVFDIPEGNKYGYAPVTKMRLSAEKLSKLGWRPEIEIIESYRRMIYDL